MAERENEKTKPGPASTPAAPQGQPSLEGVPDVAPAPAFGRMKGMASGRRGLMGPSDVLALQRTMGNRAVTKVLRTEAAIQRVKTNDAMQANEGAVNDASVGTQHVQQVPGAQGEAPDVVNAETVNAETVKIPGVSDYLAGIYGNKQIEGLDEQGRNDWLRRFTTIQDILQSESLVRVQLLRLGNLMIKDNSSLTHALTKDEWTTTRPVFSEGVDTEPFAKIVQSGQLFEDFVQKVHGIQTHRIQWFIIRGVIDSGPALEIYKESANPRWGIYESGKPTMMWDRIVDRSLSDTENFMTPQYLESFIINIIGKPDIEESRNIIHYFTNTSLSKYVQKALPSIFGDYDPMIAVSDEVKRGNDSHRENKAALQAKYPDKSLYSATLSEGYDDYMGLSDLRARKNKEKEDVEDYAGWSFEQKREREKEIDSVIVYCDVEMNKIINAARKEIIVDNKNKLKWTAWKIGDKKFTPTAAYPIHQDPNEIANETQIDQRSDETENIPQPPLNQ